MNNELPIFWIDYLVRFQSNSVYFDNSYAIAVQFYNSNYYENALTICNELYKYITHITTIQTLIEEVFIKIKDIPISTQEERIECKQKLSDILNKYGLTMYPTLTKYINKIGKTNSIYITKTAEHKKQIHELRALIYDNIANYDAAIKEYYHILDIEPDADDIKFKLSVIFYKMNNYSLALLCLDIIKGDYKDKYNVKIVRGLIYEQLGRFDDACCMYQQCVEIAPNENIALNVMNRYMETASKLPLFADK